MTKTILLILFAEAWNTAGQVFFKKGTNGIDVERIHDWKSYVDLLNKSIRQPFIWLGFASLAVGLGVWLVALAGAELSFVYPVGSLQYLSIMFAARVFLGEKIDAMKLFGTLLVVLGVILIAIS
jgi:uncharacterized membrane protein